MEHFIQSYFASYALIYIIKVTKPGLLTFSDKLIDKQLQEGEIISHWSYVNIKYGGPRVEQPVWPTGGWYYLLPGILGKWLQQYSIFK